MKRVIIAALLLVATTTVSAQVFVGLGVNSGVESTTGNATGITLGAGADLGFINTSLGTFGLSASGSLSLGTAAHTGLGVMYVSRDWRERSAFIFGAGIDLRSAVDAPYGQTVEDNGTLRESVGYRDRQGYGLILRAGVSFNRHLYVTGSVTFGSFTTNKDIYSLHHTPAGFHYEGYSTASEDSTYLTLGVNIGYRF